jgi:Fe-S cluster assembly scaffold protein SufB
MKEIIIINETSDLELHFDQGGQVVVYDHTNTQDISRKVTISNNTKLRWYGLISGQNKYALQFVTQSGESIVRILLLATVDEKLTTTIHSTLQSSHTVSNIHILSLVGESGIIELNGTVQIDANISQVKGHILEENIFLGSKGNIR